MSAWEQGRATPSHEQRVLTVEHLKDAPPEALLPLVAAFGIAAPPWLQRRARPDDAAGRRALGAIRSAADDLDLPASTVRRILAAVLAHLATAGASLDDLATALAAGSPKAPPASRRGTRPA